MIYLDANIFIYAATNNGEEGDICRDLLSEVAFKKIIGQTSFLTWDEIVHSIRRLKNAQIAIEEGKNFLEFPNLLLLKIDEKIINKAQELIDTYNLRPRDAIHAASAILNDIDEIVTDDNDFD